MNDETKPASLPDAPSSAPAAATALRTIGHTYYSGNSYCPVREVLLAVDVPANAVHATELAGWSKAYSGATPPSTFVRVSEARSYADVVRHIPTDVWVATRYESHEALIASYVQRERPVYGMPGAVLPGERR